MGIAGYAPGDSIQIYSTDFYTNDPTTFESASGGIGVLVPGLYKADCSLDHEDEIPLTAFYARSAFNVDILFADGLWGTGSRMQLTSGIIRQNFDIFACSSTDTIKLFAEFSVGDFDNATMTCVLALYRLSDEVFPGGFD
jgi:hypothetical protein